MNENWVLNNCKFASKKAPQSESPLEYCNTCKKTTRHGREGESLHCRECGKTVGTRKTHQMSGSLYEQGRVQGSLDSNIKEAAGWGFTTYFDDHMKHFAD